MSNENQLTTEAKAEQRTDLMTSLESYQYSLKEHQHLQGLLRETPDEYLIEVEAEQRKAQLDHLARRIAHEAYLFFKEEVDAVWEEGGNE